MDPRVEELTKTIIARHLGLRRERIKLSQRFRHDLGCDNLALIGIALDLEDLEHGEFPFPRLEQIDTVSDLVDVVADVLRGRDADRGTFATSEAARLTA